jgi:putative hydrolase of the HAD superfamily
MSKLPVKAVIFDLWGTLIYNIPANTPFREISELTEKPPEALWRSWREYNYQAMQGVIKSGEERARLVLEHVGCSPKIVEQVAPLLAIFEQQNRTSEVHFYPGVEDMLQTLRDKGYKVGLISNCTYLTPPVIEKIGLRKKMDLVILSCEVGFVKPQLEIYIAALQRLKVAAAECFYIGDGGDNEMTGAKSAGLITGLVEQEHGHAFRFPTKEFEVDYRLPSVTEVLDYLENS